MENDYVEHEGLKTAYSVVTSPRHNIISTQHNWGVFTLAKRFDDEGEVEEAEEEDIEFLEAGEDSAEAFESPEEPLDFVALLVESAVVFPGLDAVGLWRNDRDHAQAEHQLSGFVTLVGAIHQQRQAFRHGPPCRQQSATFGSALADCSNAHSHAAPATHP